MTSIDDRNHREQEDEKDEWETGWEYPDHMQEALRAPQWISNRPKGLEDADRIQDLIDPPALRALRRMDQIAAGSMPPWLEHVQRTEEMLKRAQGLWPGLDAMQRQHDQMMTTLGYIKVRRRRYARPTSSRASSLAASRCTAFVSTAYGGSM